MLYGTNVFCVVNQALFLLLYLYNRTTTTTTTQPTEAHVAYNVLTEYNTQKNYTFRNVRSKKFHQIFITLPSRIFIVNYFTSYRLTQQHLLIGLI